MYSFIKNRWKWVHAFSSVWKNSNYENVLSELTVEEFMEYNAKAKYIEEDDNIE